MSREEDIACDFIESDKIWPPTVKSETRHPFIKALREVLTRLPDDAYDVISDVVWFVVEDAKFLAQNVPFERRYPGLPNGIHVKMHTIVIFHTALSFSHSALVGILAHELAHCLVKGQNYQTDEALTDSLAIKWGFGKELQVLQVERG